MSKKWLKCAGIRAVKTAAQTAVAMLPVAAAINQVDWKMVDRDSSIGICGFHADLSGRYSGSERL